MTTDKGTEFTGYGSSRMQWVENWRDEFASSTPCHEVIGRGSPRYHTGWYIDNDQHELAYGVVLEIAAECDRCKGSGADPDDASGADWTCTKCESEGKLYTYQAGVADPWNKEAVVVDREDTYTDQDECARAADALAERFAESLCEDDAKYQAESQIETASDDICTTRRAHSRLIGAILKYRDGSYDNASCTRERAMLRAYVHKAVKRIRKLRENFWYSVEP